jgi:predicted acylesterase/phospholipase RssA/ABC-type phosphate/phosphonate transport system substrate-binding protein
MGYEMDRSISTLRKATFILGYKNFALLLVTFTSLLTQAAFPATAGQPVVIKIGISEYQNIEATYNDYQKFFYVLSVLSRSKDKSAANGNTAVFQISVGSYDEVIDWWNKGQIDAAVLSATPVATLLAASGEEGEKLKKSYIATVGERQRPEDPERPLLNAFCDQLPEPLCQDPLSKERLEDGARYFYRSLALVNTDHVNATSFNEVSRSNPTYLFVRPASASGYLVPFAFLKQTLPEGSSILRGPRDEALTYQHTNSIIKLLESDKPTVAFVYDSVRISGDQKDKIIGQVRTKLRRLRDTGYLDTTLIPFNALFVNYNRPEEIYNRDIEILRNAFDRFNDEPILGNAFTKSYQKRGNFTFKRFDDWISKYDEMVRILKNPPPGWNASTPVLFSASQITDELFHYANCSKGRSCERLPRLAVVLSGGGAKCAYQAGALEGIEKALDERRRACEKETAGNKYCSKVFDIDVLVGTSGGSINALLAAAGNTNTASGRLNMEHVWKTLNQNNLVEPSTRLKLWLAASFGMLQAFILAVMVALFATSRWNWLAFFDLLLIFCVVLLSVIFLVSGGQFVPVALVVQLVLVAGIVAIKPVNRFIQKFSGKHRARVILLILLVESIVFARIHGELDYSTTGMLLGCLVTGVVVIAFVAGLTRYLLTLQTVNSLKCARVFAALCAMVLALLRFVIDLHLPAVQSTIPIASTILRLVPFTPDIPASYAIPINTGLTAQLLLFVYLVIIDFETVKLRKIKDWRFYAVVVFIVIATWLPIPQQSGGHKDLVMTSAHVVGALFLLQATVWLAFFILSRSLKRGPIDWWMAASSAMFFISVAEFCIALIWVLMDYWSPPLGHWILHLGLLFIKLLIFRWVLATPVLIGLAMLLTPHVLNWLQVSCDWNQRRALPIGALAGITAVVSVLVTGVLFFLEVSVSESTAIAKTFSESMPSIVAGLKAPANNPMASNAPCSGDPDLCNISRQIITGSSIRRDLLITASRLHEHRSGAESLPDDLYFYFKRSSQKVPWDSRFVSFAKNPHLLLDAVIGSSTIYPVFPPRKLRRVCLRKEIGSGFQEEKELEIVDGGFTHNSPIEAAVSWGATHIVLIEASPDNSPQPPQHFGQHLATAFDYLFSQAQRTDVSSKGSVELFELRPENAMDVLDFSPKLLERAINEGKDDAGEGAAAKPKFHRIARAPAFREQYQPLLGNALQPSIEQGESFSEECDEKIPSAAVQKSPR